MTSQSRKNRPTIAPNTIRQTTKNNVFGVRVFDARHCGSTSIEHRPDILQSIVKQVQNCIFTAAIISAPALALGQSPSAWSPEPFVPPANIQPLRSASASSLSAIQTSSQVPSNRLRGEVTLQTTAPMDPQSNQPVVARWKSIKNQTIPKDAAKQVVANDPNVFHTRTDDIAQIDRPTADVISSDGAPRIVKKSRQSIDRAVQPAGTWANRTSVQNSVSNVRTAAYQSVENAEAPSLSQPGFSIPTLPDSITPSDVESFPPFQSPNSNQILPQTPSDEPSLSLNSNPSRDQIESRSLLEPPANQPAPSPFLPPAGNESKGSPSDLDFPPDGRSSRPRQSPKQTPPSSKGSKKLAVDCDDVRSRAVATDISAITLNVAPVFGVGPKDRSSVEEKRSRFAGSAPMRQWYDYTGRPLADGRLVDLANDSVIVESNTGERLALSIRELSDADTVYVAESWGLPVTCSLGDQTLVARQYEPSTVAWKASGMCHKPLYFEEIQLERSGHEWGPIIQPALSTAHFFGNVAFLPYKMAINPMSECQYALGHYRPGNCAPWSIEPIPLSLRGLAAEGAAIGGAALILP